ncbi:nucleotide exchange factor GrpE [Treponema sp. Marseille-Q4132]|uniref:nucleotide exchange factor GrpE n=1 Tax=Treponema sp. Marseille-Q4132 TaxID=2766701 RepID=UPI001652DCC5|nr:nucleotide exchange factor GrpE [Treponema sp. Marseille-Q4132]QNL98038.1 nucleotide exchange factor GrpE [Treponema sp. Marseille-Q4132]
MGESEKEKTENGTPLNGEAHAGMTAPTGEEKASGGKDAADCKSAEKANSCASEKSGEKLSAEDSGKDALSELKMQIDELKKENADLKDQVLRRAADFDNYRKRMLKEKQDVFDYANETLLHDLLESLDNFDRTVDAASNAKDVKSIADGVKMINASLVKMLEDKYNLSSYGAVGDTFNPDEHEAIGSVQGAVAEPVLKEVYLKGYKLKDRIIRHAKVMVTMPDGSVQSDEKAGQKSDSK